MMNCLLSALIVGVGATAAMDVWGIVRKRLLGIPEANYALVGRWLGGMPRGRFRHESIAAASPVRHERLIGWAAHYLIGIIFAGVCCSRAESPGSMRRRSALPCSSASARWQRRFC
jgi:hypothetical protein